MAVKRILVPEGCLSPGVLDLPDELASYVRDVLRLAAGDALLLADGAAHEADVELVELTKKRVRVAVREVRAVAAPAGLALTILQGVAKGEKMDAVVRQASELGARAIVPVVTARAVARQEGRVERWRAIADDATRVSGRPIRPRVEPVVPLAEVLARPRAALALCLAGGAPESLGAHLEARTRAGAAPEAAELLIGPEGGLTDAEIAAALAAGFSAVHLGPYTLRTETAGPAVAALVLHWAGAFAR